MECVRLRVEDVDFEQRQLTVRTGKGMKDRVTMLPDQLGVELRAPSCRILRGHWKGGASEAR